MALPRFIPHDDVAPKKSIYDADLEAFKSSLPLGDRGLQASLLEPTDPNYISLSKHPDFKWKTWYARDYAAIFKDLAAMTPEEQEAKMLPTIRTLIKKDLFFIVYFIMNVPPVNHPFGVQVCNELEASTPDGGLSHTGHFHNYAREHLKSTLITMGLTVKRIVNDPECTTAIFSYKKPAADKFLSGIRETLEKEIMITCFPDILYAKPDTESPSWSLQNGIKVKRQAASRKEATVEAFGLIEGMPTGGHFDHRIYDDVETFDIAKSPDQLALCFDAFEMSDNLGTSNGTEIIVGTYYSHIGALTRIRDKKDIHDNLMYKTVVKPATDDGTRNGKPVFLSQERLDKLKTSKHFDSQQLCNPTPAENVKLESRFLKSIDPHFLPVNRYKFLIIDQAGDKNTPTQTRKKTGDKWSFGIISVKPVLDDLGASDCYLEEFESDEMTHSEAIYGIVQMYLRNGLVRALGVEKVGLSTTEIHIADALRVHGRRISIENKTLIQLFPGNRSVESRVEGALQWPLNNGKLFLSTDIKEEQRIKLINEMDKFPFFHPEILNMWAYAYDVIKKYRFPTGQEARPRSLLTVMSAPIRSEMG